MVPGVRTRVPAVRGDTVATATDTVNIADFATDGIPSAKVSGAEFSAPLLHIPAFSNTLRIRNKTPCLNAPQLVVQACLLIQ